MGEWEKPEDLPLSHSRLGLFGGTFDPPHYGHLVAAQEAADRLQLDTVLFLPAGRPPHKLGEPVSPYELRCRMAELAIAGNPRFELSPADSQGDRPSYTADLLAQMRAELGPGPQFYFLVGMDSLHDLPTWKDPQRVLAQCILVAVTRPGHPSLDPHTLEPQVPGAATRIVVLQTPGVDISATDLRARVATNRPIRYLVPEAVRDFIQTHGLYRDLGSDSGSQK